MANDEYKLDPWANRILDADVFGIDWVGPEGCGRVEFVMPHDGSYPVLHTEGMRPIFIKKLLSQLVDECVMED